MMGVIEYVKHVNGIVFDRVSSRCSQQSRRYGHQFDCL